ncbi:MAG: hypothetical protein PUE13_05740, partial [Clostridiales bacterium]|nr:hypothetical protein [Clostridiales bacterium]
VSASAAYSDVWKYPMAYNRKWLSNSSYPTVYKFDFLTNDSRIGAGIRFNYIKAEDEKKSYYQLIFGGGNCGNKTTLKKMSNGKNYNNDTKKTEIADLTPTIVTADGYSTISKDTWYTAEIRFDGGEISWTLKKADDGTIVETGSYTDSEPITGTNMMSMLLGTGQNDCYVYYDNTSFTTEAPSADYEIMSCTGGEASVYAPEAGNVIVIFAAMSGSKLVSVSYKTEALIQGENPVTADEFFSDAEADTVKVMVWNPGDNSPLCESKPYVVE